MFFFTFFFADFMLLSIFYCVCFLDYRKNVARTWLIWVPISPGWVRFLMTSLFFIPFGISYDIFSKIEEANTVENWWENTICEKKVKKIISWGKICVYTNCRVITNFLKRFLKSQDDKTYTSEKKCKNYSNLRLRVENSYRTVKP